MIKRFEQKGFRLVALKMTQVTVSSPQPAHGGCMCICRLHRQVQTQDHSALEPEVVVLVACSKSWPAASRGKQAHYWAYID